MQLILFWRMILIDKFGRCHYHHIIIASLLSYFRANRPFSLDRVYYASAASVDVLICQPTVNEIKIGRSHMRTAECELCII